MERQSGMQCHIIKKQRGQIIQLKTTFLTYSSHTIDQFPHSAKWFNGNKIVSDIKITQKFSTGSSTQTFNGFRAQRSMDFYNWFALTRCSFFTWFKFYL